LYLPSIFVCIFITLVLTNINRGVALIVCSFICVVYAAQLYVNARNYRFAGNVVRQTLDELGKDSSRNLLIENLPRAQHGALILENGLPDAIELFRLGKNAGLIKIVSQRSETKPLQAPYKTIYIPVSEDVAVTRFVFTDTALVIYR
jgi:hypothetical protein